MHETQPPSVFVHQIVRAVETAQQVEQDRHQDRGRHPLPERRLFQIDPFDELEDQIGLVLVRPDVVDRLGVGMIEEAADADLPQEGPLGGLLLPRVGSHHLDREQATEPDRAGAPTDVNGAHPPLSELGVHLVGTESEAAAPAAAPDRDLVGLDRDEDPPQAKGAQVLERRLFRQTREPREARDRQAAVDQPQEKPLLGAQAGEHHGTTGDREPR